MSKILSSAGTDTKTEGSHTPSQADFKLWSDFLSRSESMNNHTLTTSSPSKTPASRSSNLDDEVTVDTILADYRSREAQRRSNAGEADAANMPSTGFKTAHEESPQALLNRIRGLLGNIVDGKGWRT